MGFHPLPSSIHSPRKAHAKARLGGGETWRKHCATYTGKVPFGMQFEGRDLGDPVFCIQCSRLFSKFGDKDDDDLGRPRCGDCASKARLAEAVGFASRNQELQARSTLSRLIAQHDAEERIRRGEEGKDDEGNTSNHTTRGGAASSVDERESGVAALHGLVVQTRRENNDLRRRLHAALNEVTAEEAVKAGRRDGHCGGSSAPLVYREEAGPMASLSLLLDGFIPPQLRTTTRYQPLADKIDEMAHAWRDRERRLRALQAALLSAEATSTTLQEEMLLVESSQIALGQLVKAQQDEIRTLRLEQTESHAQVAAAEKEARLADVRCAEAEAVLRLRHDSEANLRQQCRELQRALADVHTSLGSFTTQQQARRAREVVQRQRQLSSWEGELRSALEERAEAVSNGGNGSGGGMEEQHALVRSLREVLGGAMREHNDALAALDGRVREADAVEREWYEKRIEALEERVGQLEAARVEMDTSLDSAKGRAQARQLNLLRKQRDEAFEARDFAVDELRTRVVQQGHALGAMRRGFGEGAEQLSLELHRLPASDASLGHELAEHNHVKRKLEASRVRIAQLAFHSWRVRFLTQVWSAWRVATSQAQLKATYKSASKTVKKATKHAKAREKRAAEEQAEEARKAHEEFKRHARAVAELEAELQSARSKEDAARAGAASAVAETQALMKRLREAEAEVAARAGEAKLAKDSLEKARTLEALWYEQREALLEEAEALRQELELYEKGDASSKLGGSRWRKRAAELEEEVVSVSQQAGEARKRAEELQLALAAAVAEAEAKQEALDALERQREREKAMDEASKPPESLGNVPSPYNAALATGGGSWSPAGAAAFSGNAEGLSVHLHGASWLVEARDRQAKAEALEEEAALWKERLVTINRHRVRTRRLLAIYHAWGGLAAASRRRQAAKLAKMAGQVLEQAQAASASRGTPTKKLAMVDHSEWWERGSPVKTRAPRQPLKMGAMV